MYSDSTARQCNVRAAGRCCSLLYGAERISSESGFLGNRSNLKPESELCVLAGGGGGIYV